MEVVFVIAIIATILGIIFGILVGIYYIVSIVVGIPIGLTLRIYDTIMEHYYYKLSLRLSTLSYIAKKQKEKFGKRIKNVPEEVELTRKQIREIASKEKKYLEKQMSIDKGDLFEPLLKMIINVRYKSSWMISLSYYARYGADRRFFRN